MNEQQQYTEPPKKNPYGISWIEEISPTQTTPKCPNNPVQYAPDLTSQSIPFQGYDKAQERRIKARIAALEAATKLYIEMYGWVSETSDNQPDETYEEAMERITTAAIASAERLVRE